MKLQKKAEVFVCIAVYRALYSNRTEEGRKKSKDEMLKSVRDYLKGKSLYKDFYSSERGGGDEPQKKDVHKRDPKLLNTEELYEMTHFIVKYFYDKKIYFYDEDILSHVEDWIHEYKSESSDKKDVEAHLDKKWNIYFR